MTSVVMWVLFERKEAEKIKEVAKLRGEDTSSFFRRAVRIELAKLGYLTSQEQKALGIETEKANSRS